MAEQPVEQERPAEITGADLPKKLSDFVLKADAAAEQQNYKYAITLLQTVLKQYFFFTIARRPVIVPIIIEV